MLPSPTCTRSSPPPPWQRSRSRRTIGAPSSPAGAISRASPGRESWPEHERYDDVRSHTRLVLDQPLGEIPGPQRAAEKVSLADKAPELAEHVGHGLVLDSFGDNG